MKTNTVWTLLLHYLQCGTNLVVRHIVWSIEKYYTLLNHWLLCKSVVGIPLVEHSWHTHYITDEGNHFFHFKTLVGSVGLRSCMFPYQVKVGYGYDITNVVPTTKKKQSLLQYLAGFSDSQMTLILCSNVIVLTFMDCRCCWPINMHGISSW